jgi:antitoxin Phd
MPVPRRRKAKKAVVARGRSPSQVLPFLNRRGEEVEIASVTATDAKNEFGRVLETAMANGAVAITRHDTAKAVLLSVDEYNALVAGRHGELKSLSDEFDTLLSQMQMPRARTGMKAAFDASPAELGKAALRAARRRG